MVPVVGTKEVEEAGGEAEARVALSDYLLTRTALPLTNVTVLVPKPCVPQTLGPLLPPIGGRLANFWQEWVQIGAEPWVLTTLKEGHEIPFLEPPPLSLGLDPLFHSTLVLNEQK